MSANGSLGALVQSFFLDHLICVKGLRPASVRSYRDTVRLFLGFVAADKGGRITGLGLDDLSFERVLAFLKHLEADRGNHIATRNQRLAALHCLFEYVASRSSPSVDVKLASFGDWAWTGTISQRASSSRNSHCPPNGRCFITCSSVRNTF